MRHEAEPRANEGDHGTYRVRPATPDDRDVVAEFNRAMALETEGKTLDPAVLREGVARILGDPARGRYFLAESAQGEVAGQASVTYEWSDWRNGSVWWIQSVYVAPGHRRKGVYSRLHRHIAAAARREGAIGLRLYVENDNRGARETYRALGMREAPYRVFQELWGVPDG